MMVAKPECSRTYGQMRRPGFRLRLPPGSQEVKTEKEKVNDFHFQKYIIERADESVTVTAR